MSITFPRDPAAIERVDPDLVGTELDNLTQFLDYHRLTFTRKCAGLTEEQLKRRAAPPSGLSLLGVMRHLSEVERHWFGACLDGRPVDDYYCTPDNLDGDFDDLDSATVDEVWTHYLGEIAESRRVLATFATADDLSRATSGPRSRSRTLRWVLLHLLEEYARHNGHADLLREAIDGSTGE